PRTVGVGPHVPGVIGQLQQEAGSLLLLAGAGHHQGVVAHVSPPYGLGGVNRVVSVAAAKHSYETAYSRSACPYTWFVVRVRAAAGGVVNPPESGARHTVTWPVM